MFLVGGVASRPYKRMVEGLDAWSQFMEKEVEDRTGGTAVHVGDCYTWTAIQYLDSPTDYGEYLPRRVPLTNDEMRVLDDEEHLSWGEWPFLTIIVVVISVIVAAFVGCLT